MDGSGARSAVVRALTTMTVLVMLTVLGACGTSTGDEPDAFDAAAPPPSSAAPLPDLGPIPPGPLAAVPSQQDSVASATVVGDTILVFTATVTAQQKTDVINSLALAQLSARRTINPNANRLGYYSRVENILRNLTYLVQPFQQGRPPPRQSTLDSFALDLMSNITTSQNLQLLRNQLDVLRGSAGAGGAPWTVFDSNARSGNQAGFTIALADSANGRVELRNGGFQVRSASLSNPFLWAPPPAPGTETITDGSSAYVLDEEVYAQARDQVAQRVSGYLGGYVANIP